MAVTTINLSDPISTLVTKTNTISADLGDKAALTTNVTTNLVTAINSVRDQILDVDDSSDIIHIVNTEYALTTATTINNLISDSATLSNATLGQVTADSASILAGVATLTSATITSGTITTLNSTDATIDSAQFTKISLDGINNISDLKPLQIYNSAGSVILAGYLLSTSNNNGTL